MKRGSKSGFALVLAIWLSGLLAAILASFMLKLRSETLIAANMSSNARVEAIADGIARSTALELSQVPRLSSGVYRRCMWSDGNRIEISVQDQAGLLDINTVPKQILLKFIPDKQTVDSIIDYRDNDTIAESGGSEPTIYPGQNFGPKNAPFLVIEELQQVPGISLDMFERLLPFITVHSFEVGVDELQLPPGLREIFTQENASFSGYRTTSKNFSVMIDVRAESADGRARFRRKAIAVLHRQPERPFSFITWQRDAQWGTPLKGNFVASCFGKA